MFNPPLIVKKIFNEYFWQTSNNEVLLTFDDGPLLNNTETILSRLGHLKIKALFFVVGGNCEKNPSLIQEILSEGHTIGNHTFNHKVPAMLSADELKKEIDDLNSLILNQYNYMVKYFRPPHGRFSVNLNRILKEKEMRNVMWSLLTFDYKNDYKLVKFAIDKYLQKNSIVVLHDSLKSKKIIADSINYLYDCCQSRGYNFGDAEECLK